MGTHTRVVKRNRFYVLKRRRDSLVKWVIYRAEEFGGDFFQTCKTAAEAKKAFETATKEAVAYEKKMA